MLVFLTAVVGLGLLAAGRDSLGDGKPDFTGKWELDNNRSSFGKMKRPTRMTLEAARHGEALHAVQTAYDQAQGPDAVEGDWYLDGKERPVNQPGDIVSMSKWDGNTLVAERKSKDGSYSESIRLTLSRDGKTATEDITVKDPNGSDKRKLVWERRD